MSTAAGYTKTRAEIVALFGWNAGALSAEQVLRVDCATALRLGLDALQGALIRGESVDMSRMLTASSALANLLPAAVLAAPPEERRADSRAALLELILQMRERDGVPDEGIGRDDEFAALKAEIAQLRARLGDVPPTLGPNPPRSNVVPDIVPPSEQADRDFHIGGPKPAPDDSPRTPTVIEGKAEPVADDSVDLRAGFGNVDEPWRAFSTDIEGNPLTARRGKWWGPA